MTILVKYDPITRSSKLTEKGKEYFDELDLMRINFTLNDFNTKNIMNKTNKQKLEPIVYLIKKYPKIKMTTQSLYIEN